MLFIPAAARESRAFAHNYVILLLNHVGFVTRLLRARADHAFINTTLCTYPSKYQKSCHHLKTYSYVITRIVIAL